MNYTEFPVFPMITCGKVNSSTDPKAKWKLIVSVPPRTLATPTLKRSHARLYGVGGWLVVIWNKKASISEKAEIALYEASKGSMAPSTDEFGNVRIRALNKQNWISLINVELPEGNTRNRRYSGAIVEGEDAIQIWTKLQ